MSKAALLGMEQATDSKGKPYYKYELLTTAGTPRLRGLFQSPSSCSRWLARHRGYQVALQGHSRVHSSRFVLMGSSPPTRR